MAAPLLLTLRPLGLGDLLTAVPALRALRRGFPSHEHVLACGDELRELVLLTHAVDRVLPARPLEPLAFAESPDIAVDLHGRGPASHRVLLKTQPRRLIAFANEAVPESRDGPAWRDDEHEVARWCRLLESAGLAADPGDLRLDVPAVPWLDRYAGCAVVHPGAASAARRWPACRFAAVAQHLVELGCEVVVTGDSREVALAAEVARRAPGAISLAGLLSHAGLLALVGHARLLVCGDTGVAHVASATGTPSVVLFGPTAPSRWGPPVSPRHRVLWSGTRGDPHGAAPDPGLLAIDVDAVLVMVAEQLRLSEATVRAAERIAP